MRSRVRTWLSLFAMLCSLSCKAGGAAQAVRPQDPAASDALDGNAECRDVSGPAQPLVVDWKSEQRASLELAMKDGVAVVAYDCQRLELLDQCRLEGSYAFAGVTRKEETVQLVDNDELAANVPLGKATIAAGLTRGSSLDVALVMVGRKGTTVAQAATPQLVGACEGATHFVRGAFVGAFAMTTGTAGQLRAVADIFGAGASASSTSDRSTDRKDGDLTACRQSTPDATAPPPECQSAIRLQLEPIAAEWVASKDGEGEEGGTAAACPKGLVWAGGKCSVPSEAAHQCAPDDAEDCAAQCERGDAGSCFEHAQLLGDAGSAKPEEIQALYERACEGDIARACARAGWVWSVTRVNAKDATAQTNARMNMEKYYARACELGDAYTCWNTSGWYLREGELAIFPKDPPRARALLQRSCDLGYAAGCSSLAKALITGKDFARDVPTALGLLVRGCDGGRAEDCTQLGDLQLAGKAVAKDAPQALAAYRRGCDRGSAIACARGGDMLATGDGVDKDEAGAVAIWSKACREGAAGWDACFALGNALEKGLGVPKDAAAAAEAYERGCMKGGCARAGKIWEKGLGVDKDKAKAAAAYVKGCQMAGDKAACKGAKRLGAAVK